MNEHTKIKNEFELITSEKILVSNKLENLISKNDALKIENV